MGRLGLELEKKARVRASEDLGLSRGGQLSAAENFDLHPHLARELGGASR